MKRQSNPNWKLFFFLTEEDTYSSEARQFFLNLLERLLSVVNDSVDVLQRIHVVNFLEEMLTHQVSDIYSASLSLHFLIVCAFICRNN